MALRAASQARLPGEARRLRNMGRGRSHSRARWYPALCAASAKISGYEGGDRPQRLMISAVLDLWSRHSCSGGAAGGSRLRPSRNRYAGDSGMIRPGCAGESFTILQRWGGYFGRSSHQGWRSSGRSVSLLPPRTDGPHLGWWRRQLLGRSRTSPPTAARPSVRCT